MLDKHGCASHTPQSAGLTETILRQAKKGVMFSIKFWCFGLINQPSSYGTADSYGAARGHGLNHIIEFVNHACMFGAGSCVCNMEWRGVLNSEVK